MRESIDAYQDARRLGLKRPDTGYTAEAVRNASDSGAALVLDELGLGEAEEDAINLTINALMTCLTNPAASFTDVLDENYIDTTAEEIRSWWGWNK